MRRAIVVDSCVAVKWLIKEQDSDDALRILESGVRICCPDFVLTELTNILWKNKRLERISELQHAKALKAAPGFFDQLVPASDLLAATAALADRLDHAAYDCFYAATASLLDADFVTTDLVFLGKLRAKRFRGALDLSGWCTQLKLE